MKKFLISLSCFTLGVVTVSYMYSEVVEHHQRQYDKCLSTQDYSIEWDCHCFEKWYLAHPVMQNKNERTKSN